MWAHEISSDYSDALLHPFNSTTSLQNGYACAACISPQAPGGSNIGLAFPLSSHFFFQEPFFFFKPTTCLFGQCLVTRQLIATIIPRPFQSGDALFQTTSAFGQLQLFPQFVQLCICWCYFSRQINPSSETNFLRFALTSENVNHSYLHGTISLASPALPTASINYSKR